MYSKTVNRWRSTIVSINNKTRLLQYNTLTIAIGSKRIIIILINRKKKSKQVFFKTTKRLNVVVGIGYNIVFCLNDSNLILVQQKKNRRKKVRTKRKTTYIIMMYFVNLRCTYIVFTDNVVVK